MDRAREELLAGSRFPVQQHRHVAVRDHTRRTIERGAERRARSQNPLEAILRLLARRELAAPGERLQPLRTLLEPRAQQLVVLREREVLRCAGAHERYGEPMAR